MVIKFVEARCLNCKQEVKQEQDTCTKCGDPVAVRPPGKKPFFEQVAEVREVPEQADGTAPAVRLSDEQERAIERIRGWYESTRVAGPPEPFRLFGPAGTGKTTLAKHLAAALGTSNIAFGAYTGKAAHVLRSKGIAGATTIHSALYTPSSNRELRLRLIDLRMELVSIGTVGIDNPQQARKEELEAQIEQAERELRKPHFEFDQGSEWGYADLIVLDEVSMVNTKMADDIERLGVPVLVLGDPFQLPPIDGGGHYTNAEPNVLLTEVHRQALESPVLHLATDVRLGMPWRSSLVKVDLAEAMAADQVLVWKNSTRWSLIERMRAKRGCPAGAPVAGDRIMCLVNNKDAGVLNGQQYTVVSAGEDGGIWEILAEDDEGQARELLAYAEGFQGLAKEKEAKDTFRAFRGEVGLFTFADAITVHKAQGSEWPHVYVVDQTHQMTRDTREGKARWLYTGITRARDRVTLASTEVK